MHQLEVFHPSELTVPIPKYKATARQVCPGDIICEASGFLRGHGTFIDADNNLVASVAGVVETVNKFVMVKPLKGRYAGDVGDVTVGRITTVGEKRWKVDTHSKQDAALLLSSIDLPGDVRRRRTQADQLRMRDFFVENDLISAEVQAFFQDGGMSIHTRTNYGKLSTGFIVQVSASLIKRSKTHFHNFNGVGVIMSNNGMIWIHPAEEKEEDDGAEEVQKKPKTVDAELRLSMARFRNSILALSSRSMAIHPTTMLAVYNRSITLQYHPKQMLHPNVVTELVRDISTTDL